MFRPLILRAELSEPIAGAEELHLDGLLMAVHRYVRNAPNRALSAGMMRFSELRHPSRVIAYIEHEGHVVPMASTMMGDWTLDVDKITQRRDGFDVECLKGKFNRSAGADRDKLLTIPLRVCREVHWTCLGNRRAILDLCRNIRSIGAHRRHGYGAVAKWTCERIDRFDLIDASGVTCRHLPGAWCEASARQDFGAVEPPYWHPNRFTARAPARSQVVLTKSASHAVAAVLEA